MVATPPGELVGYWIWRSVRARGHTVQIVTDQDMEPRAGSRGWPGCPEWYLCTRYGINAVAFGPAGEFWFVNNVVTSSDAQHIGRYAVAQGTITVQRDRFYSCAHPDRNDPLPATLYLRSRVVSDELWLGTNAANRVHLASAPWPEPDSWMVFRRVSEQAFLQDYLLRRCQDEGREPRCFEGCFSNEYGR